MITFSLTRFFIYHSYNAFGFGPIPSRPNLSITAKKKLKVVCISDTHCKHWDINLPKGDVLIHAGDFTLKGTENEIKNFNI